MRVLVVEDEKRLAAGLKRGLEAEGFAVDVSLDDGSQVDVHLDRDFSVVSTDADGVHDDEGRDDD